LAARKRTLNIVNCQLSIVILFVVEI
jgi:hypothetical protein